MRVQRVILWGMSIVLIAQVGLYSQSPPFSEKVSLKGSTLYNAEDNGSTDPDSDWLVDRSDTINGRIFMDFEGLVFKPGIAVGDSVRHQLKRGFQVSDGKAVVALRIKVSNVNQIGFYIGLYSLEADPYFEESGGGTKPTYSVYFSNPATGDSKNKVSLRTRNNDAGNEETDEFEIESGEAYDIVIEVDSAGTNSVRFSYRTCPSSLWTSTTVTASVPEDTADLYFSMAVFTESLGTGHTLTVQLFEYEADAGG